METHPTHSLPGIYQYTYPTFVDTPQYISVHFLTPDGQQAFVSYPRHPNRKAAQLIPLSWFESVVMVKLESQPQLMTFLDVVLTGWVGIPCAKRPSAKRWSAQLSECSYSGVLAA